MSVSPDSIVFLNELLETPSLIEQRLRTQDSLVIIAHDQIQGVLLPKARYQHLLEAERQLSSHPSPSSLASFATESTEPISTSPLRIGLFVRNEMEKLFSSDQLSNSEIALLCDRDYCRTTFRMSFPVLKKVPAACESDAKLLHTQCCDRGGYLRYYAHAYPLYDSFYVLCNNWRENPHRAAFTAWLEGLTNQRSQQST